MRKLSLVFLALAACPKNDPPVTKAPAAEVSTVTVATAKEEGDCHHDDTPAAAPANEKVFRGAPFKGEKAVALTDLLAKPESFDKQTIATEGTVRQVCQKKGCWMELAMAEKGPGARITFKDYEFFVPKDSAGKKAKLEGAVKLAELSEERAKHYASEGATIPRGADGKAREVQLVATGVEILN